MLVDLLAQQGITQPFPIQVSTLPSAIGSRDVLGRGQTGSGKTLAFGLALLTQLALRKPVPGKPAALVLSPTRELAQQTDTALTPLAKAVRLNTQVVAGGLSYDKQITAISRGAQIIIATPGRLIDLINRGSIDLSAVQITVLDEADQMADMGFLPDVRMILDLVRPGGQKLLFSATLDKGVDTIVDEYMNEPSVHAVDSGQASVESMQHHIVVLNPKEKDDILAQIGGRAGRTIMFVRSQLGADRIGENLAAVGVPVGVLHGGKTQRVRNRTLDAFKNDRNGVLVATDVAARGIHVDDVSLVLHIDPPNNAKDYLHRAGRTARAGESGVVVSLTTTRQRSRIVSMLSKAGVDAESTYVTSMSDELIDITGAREPSGIPWRAPADEPERGRPQQRANRRRREDFKGQQRSSSGGAGRSSGGRSSGGGGRGFAGGGNRRSSNRP
jgi:superfamily II DNA/RNA helicase